MEIWGPGPAVPPTLRGGLQTGHLVLLAGELSPQFALFSSNGHSVK